MAAYLLALYIMLSSFSAYTQLNLLSSNKQPSTPREEDWEFRQKYAPLIQAAVRLHMSHVRQQPGIGSRGRASTKTRLYLSLIGLVGYRKFLPWKKLPVAPSDRAAHCSTMRQAKFEEAQTFLISLLSMVQVSSRHNEIELPQRDTHILISSHIISECISTTLPNLYWWHCGCQTLCVGWVRYIVSQTGYRVPLLMSRLIRQNSWQIPR